MPYRTHPTRTGRGRTALYAALAATVIGSGFVASPTSASSPTCTITGTPGNDTLRGTTRSDVICGLGGNDVLIGNGGNDVLNGGAGNDRLDGGAGNDVINGEAGNDVIVGGDGTDTASGGAGNDRIDGGAGNDVIVGGDGTDSVSGGSGNDRIDGSAGNDTVSGGVGSDVLNGGAGADAVTPGTGNDICAADSADRVSGSCSRDTTPPSLTWIDVPSEVTAGTTFTATFSLTDPSGITTGSPAAFLGGASGWVTWCGFPLEATQVSGSATDGVWQITCSVPEQAVTETYSLFLSAQDFFANSAWVSPTAGGKGELRVVGGNSDNVAPVISNLVLPESAGPGDTVTFTWDAADTTGVAYAIVWVYGPNGPISLQSYSNPFSERTTESATEASFSQTIVLPADAAAGTYAAYISTADTLGNKTMQQYASFTVG
jgi:hypothetical protein